MNIQKLALLALVSSISCGIMASDSQRASSPQRDLPSALDRKKFNGDRNLLSTALEVIMMHYGDMQYAVDSNESRDLLLRKLKATWKKESFADNGALVYTFNSYMERAGINIQWMEQWYHEEQSKKNDKVVTGKEFTAAVWKRLNNQLAQYDSGETR